MMKDMANFEQAVNSLAAHFPEAAEALKEQREAKAEFLRRMDERIVTPEFPEVRAHNYYVMRQGSYEVLASCSLEGTMQSALDNARRIAAALNATRDRTIEQLEGPDPLGYGEVCREQREACAKAAHAVVCVKYRMVGPLKRDLESAVLETPAPDREVNP